MSDQNTIDTAYGATKAITESETFKNLTNPPAKSIGNAFSNLFDWVLGNTLYEKAEISRLKHQKNIDSFKKQLAEDIKSIPENNLIYPKESIVGPALEASKYYYNEKEIRAMFEKLIVNSMDNRKVNSVHPSFTEIIKQISPLDAQNLKLFSEDNPLPICQYISEVESDIKEHRIIKTNVFLSNPNCLDVDLQSSSLSSLERVGLIDIDYNNFIFENKLYDMFTLNSYFYLLKKSIDKDNLYRKEQRTLKANKGLARLTPLGHDFISVCVNSL